MIAHTGDPKVQQALLAGFQLYLKAAARVAYPLLSPKPAFTLAFVHANLLATPEALHLRNICHYPEPPPEGSECFLVAKCLSAKCKKLVGYRTPFLAKWFEKNK